MIKYGYTIIIVYAFDITETKMATLLFYLLQSNDLLIIRQMAVIYPHIFTYEYHLCISTFNAMHNT